MKQQPTRLTEAERQARRQHQIDLGKATQGYKNLTVLRSQGQIRNGPMTPDPTVKVSKRQFDKEIREWRRKLHAFDDVIFDQEKQQRSKELTPDLAWNYREWSKSSSVSSDAHTKKSLSLSPEMDPNFILRKRIENLVLKNHMCMERLQKQNLLISHLLELNYGRRYDEPLETLETLEPLHNLDRFDDFRTPANWEKDPYDLPPKSYCPWEDERYAEEPHRTRIDGQYRDYDLSDRQKSLEPVDIGSVSLH